MAGMFLLPAIALMYSESLAQKEKTPCVFEFNSIEKLEILYEVEFVEFANVVDSKQIIHNEKCARLPIKKVAKDFGIDPALLFAVILIESNCEESAIGAVGEIGLGQIRPEIWAQKLEQAGIYDIASVEAAAWVLAYHVHKMGEYEGVQRYNGFGEQAQNYRDKVLTLRDNLKKKM